MRKFNLVFSAIILLALGFVACEKSEELSGGNSRMKAPEYDEKLAKEYNADFDSVAFAVNQLLLNDPDFRTIVRTEVGEQFDGDYNVLISQLVVNYNPVVEDWFAKYNVDIRSIVEKYPLIQIAIPVEYEEWDGQNGLPVVFVPYEFDESKTESVDGYDAGGNNMSISTLEDPGFPVAVISENESTILLDNLPTEPEMPQNLTATEEQEGIMLEWEQYSDEDEVGYDIYRKVDSDTAFVQIASLVTSKSNQNTYSFFDGDIFGGKYEYYVVSSGNHTTGQFIVTKDDVYNLVQNPKILYSGASNAVLAYGPEERYIDLKIYYHTSNSLKLEWSSIFGPPYEIFRARSDNPNNYQHIGTTTSTYFIDTNLDGGRRYIYGIGQEFDTSPRSNVVVSYASYRSNTQKVQLKDWQLYHKKALEEIECWTGGRPEMRVRCCISNENGLVKNYLIEIPRPKNRKASYEDRNSVNEVFLNKNEVNTKGSIVSFIWWEEDKCGNKDRSIKGEIYYESHYKTYTYNNYLYNCFFAPLTEITKLYKKDYLICEHNGSDNNAGCNQLRVFEWWHENNENSVGGYIERHPDQRVTWRLKTVN